MSGRPANYALALTTGVTIHRELSPAAKLYLAAAAALPGHDPGVRRLESVLRLRDQTLSAAALELERSGLARLIRRKGKRTIVEPCGLAVPFDEGRHRYAVLPAPLVRRARDAGIDPLGLLVLQRLCRQQSARGAAQVPADVLAADLAIAPSAARKLLRELRDSELIERHAAHPLHTDDTPILTVPLASGHYPIDVGRLDPERTRVLEQVQLGEHRLTVLAARSDLARIAARVAAHEPRAAEAAAAALAAGNLTGAVVLGEDLLAALSGTTLPPVWDDTYPRFGTTLSADRDDTSKDLALAVERRHAFGVDGGAPQLDAERAGRRDNFSGDEDEGQTDAATSTRPGTRTYRAPYRPSVSYTARPQTHERIAALLDAVARRLGDDEAGGAAYEAVRTATEEWTRGATGSAVLAALSRRWGDLADAADAPVIELDFGAIGGDDDGE